MKIKEHSKQVKEKVVEKFQAGLDLRKISQALNISKNTVQSIIQKYKEYSSPANLPRHPAVQTIPSHRALFGDGSKRPVVILEKLPRSTNQGRRMDGVGWSSSRSQESFRANTLSRLASFITRTETKQHAQNHQPSPLSLYGCQDCEKGVSYQKDLLQRQELLNTLPKPHRCSLCGQQFSLRSSLQLHQCDVDTGQCDGCHGPTRHGTSCMTLLSNPDRLQEKSLRQPHLLDSSPYACAPCGRSFSQKQALLHHQQAGCSGSPSAVNVADICSLPYDSPPVSEGDSAHSDMSDVPGPSSDAVSMCQICSRIFCTEAALLRHIQDSHVEKKLNAKTQSDREEDGTVEASESPKSKKKLLSCRSCDMVFRCTSKLYVHRKEKHRREKLIRREQRPVIKKLRKVVPYPCQICSKVFHHHLSFRAHCRRHVEEGCAPINNGTVEDSKPLKLNPDVAKNRLKVKKTRRAGPGRPRNGPRVLFHVDYPAAATERQQLEQSEFPCPSCPEVFSVQQQLKEHMELHQSSSRRHQCSVCTSEMDACKGPGSKRQRLYHCGLCQQGFSALDPFLEHCQEHLRIRVEEDRMSEGHALQGSKA